jgi:hypothetical protein
VIKWHRCITFLCLVGVCVAACQSKTPTRETDVAAPQTWIDAPLGHSVLPIARHEIIAHATNPNGIASFEFSVNGEVIATDPVLEKSDHTLAQMSQMWSPAVPGTYLLGVRAAGPDRTFGLPAEVRVVVGSGQSPTESRTPMRRPPPSRHQVPTGPRH